MVIRLAGAAGWVVGEGLGLGVLARWLVLVGLVWLGAAPGTLLGGAVKVFLGRGVPEACRALLPMLWPRNGWWPEATAKHTHGMSVMGCGL